MPRGVHGLVDDGVGSVVQTTGRARFGVLQHQAQGAAQQGLHRGVGLALHQLVHQRTGRSVSRKRLNAAPPRSMPVAPVRNRRGRMATNWAVNGVATNATDCFADFVAETVA